MLQKDDRKGSIIIQVGLIFVLCVVITGLITYTTQYNSTISYVTRQTEARSERAAAETERAFHEYPSYRWLFQYWYEHWDELDIEYDVYFTNSTKTEKKCAVLNERYPDMELRYASEQKVKTMAPEDQKLFAEIMYTWILTRLNEIKSINGIDYLFVVMTESPYTNQFFIMSAADPGAVRGTEYEQVYPIGVTSEVGASQQEAMKNAVKHDSHIADAGKYVDYYSYINLVSGKDVLIGLTFNLTEIMQMVSEQTQKNTMMAMGYQILYSLLCSFALLVFVLNPLKMIQSSIREYKETKDSKKVARVLSKIELNNEIGDLSNDFTELTHEIDDYVDVIQRITSEKERIGAELNLAKQIQTSMLPQEFPPFPERDEFDIYASMNPAREVGGDFYDYFMTDDDHLWLVIADVSGKGIPAALFMMISMIILRIHAKTGSSPAEVLAKANESICSRNTAEMFVTVWIGVLEISTGKIAAANAGHEYPAIKHGDGKFELIKDKHGLVAGGMEGAKYTEYEIDLEPGSKVFVYTDGVPEATAEDKEMFGTDRMIDALNNDSEASPEDILKNVRRAVDDFVQDAEQFDDLTMLCIEYKG